MLSKSAWPQTIHNETKTTVETIITTIIKVIIILKGKIITATINFGQGVRINLKKKKKKGKTTTTQNKQKMVDDDDDDDDADH